MSKLEKWKTKIAEGSNGYIYVVNNYGNEICTCYGGFDKTTPNALLISKAPELLEALNNAITLLYGSSEFETMEHYRKSVEDFEQLIKQATEL